MAKSKRRSKRADKPSKTADESGGFLGQLGLVETGSSSVFPFGVALAFVLAVLTYPIGWLWRRTRRRG